MMTHIRLRKTEHRRVRNSGLKQTDVAKKLGKLQSFVSNYESGERRLDLLELQSLCEVLGLQLSAFVKRFEAAGEKFAGGLYQAGGAVAPKRTGPVVRRFVGVDVLFRFDDGRERFGHGGVHHGEADCDDEDSVHASRIVDWDR